MRGGRGWRSVFSSFALGLFTRFAWRQIASPSLAKKKRFATLRHAFTGMPPLAAFGDDRGERRKALVDNYSRNAAGGGIGGQARHRRAAKRFCAVSGRACDLRLRKSRKKPGSERSKSAAPPSPQTCRPQYGTHPSHHPDTPYHSPRPQPQTDTPGRLHQADSSSGAAGGSLRKGAVHRAFDLTNDGQCVSLVAY